jgi:serine phosphatase RsbU (regulator of sigma subunit)
MTKTIKYFLIGLAFFFIHLNSFGQQSQIDSSIVLYENIKPLIISSDTIKVYALNPHLQFIAETSNQFTIEQISSPEFSSKFTSLPVDGLGKYNGNDTTLDKIKSKTYWLRFNIKSNLSYDKEWILKKDQSDCISSFYMIDSAGKITVKKTGDIPLKERDFKYDDVINFLVRGRQSQIFYLKITYDDRKSLKNITVELKNKDELLERIISTRLLNGIFIGIFLIMALYNSILYLSIKEQSYLYYVLYIFSFAAFIIVAAGYGYEFLWQNHPDWNIHLSFISGCSFLLFYVLFGKEYLNTKKYLPKWNRIIVIQIIGLIASVAAIPLMVADLLPTWAREIIALIMLLFGFSSFIILLIPAILCIKKGIGHAYYFLLGNIMVALGVGLTFLAANTEIESIHFLQGLSIYSGVTMEIIIFSIGIGAKVNGLSKDKVKAQEETIAQLEENEILKDKVNRELEEKVLERTIEVVKQKNLIEEHQKEIIDSITYAKRLQDAILPPLSEINENISENFVLFKPKDIVAGDFYWAEKTENYYFIAAADCTGHGVPGAMVSMVCSNALNRTVNEFGITETGKILDNVRELVLDVFKKSGEEINDGMDISLCRIANKNNEIQCSGANNPLWYFIDNELIEIKANKQPIGKYAATKPFTTHSLVLPSSTNLYMFTDGYADQFSSDDKKMTKKRFKDVVISVQAKTMAEQAKIINEFFENWRQNAEQVDDVCVIGIRT